MKKKYKIAFIIAIIVIILFILLALTLFNNNIISKLVTSTKKLSESDARQKIETVLENAKSAKQTDPNYNSEDYLTSLFNQNDLILSGNIASNNGYNFIIDRENLSISENLGSTTVTLDDELSEMIDSSSANFLIKINSNINIDSVVFENTDGTLTTETR